MPTDYTLQDLADLAGVTQRTVRYYIAQGLLPSPGRVGPGTSYGEGHLARLRLIRQLQREHLPLAEIRARLNSLDDAAVLAVLEVEPAAPADSALDYIRRVLEPTGAFERTEPYASLGMDAGPQPLALRSVAFSAPPAPASQPPASEPVQPDRSQWDRIVLAPDVELHVRRPLTRQLNKQVDRLVAIARQLLEEV